MIAHKKLLQNHDTRGRYLLHVNNIYHRHSSNTFFENFVLFLIRAYYQQYSLLIQTPRLLRQSEISERLIWNFRKMSLYLPILLILTSTTDPKYRQVSASIGNGRINRNYCTDRYGSVGCRSFTKCDIYKGNSYCGIHKMSFERRNLDIQGTIFTKYQAVEELITLRN